ncbi:chlororespiratory reduction protein 7 [Candidatus Cyanaurora vandensis]|uniref:chlororespiratory reduction protein 7 n=1 Tax=Candidatus Cyanaurora vandensis TaxID=2714958 RepID=UPI00257951FF|nr:chlororespiratory reduction protein 7 [Candidatus Cyanaurora vandensis]
MNDDDQYYVLLETDREEQLLTEDELKVYLAGVLAREQGLTPVQAQAEVPHLLDTACEIPLEAGRFCQWYATRIDRPSIRKRSW